MVARLERKKLGEMFSERDFSNWVRDNLDQLNEVTRLSLSKAMRERPAGDFRVDLVATDSDGTIAIIENQLGQSDHNHLGKVLTYLTAYDAKIAIWIVEEPRAEHVTTVAWLNQSSPVDFYMVKVEAVKIGNSDFAPLFSLISAPSEESKEIAGEKEQLGEAQRHTERRNFWKALLNEASKKTSLHSGRSPSTDNWLSAGSGKGGISFAYVIRKHDVNVELWIDRNEEETKKIYDSFRNEREEIEKAFGEKLWWSKSDGRRVCRIGISSDLGGYRDPDKWEKIFSWMTNKMVALEKAFRPQIDALKL